ncbi:MAG: UDP-N-acetylmuramate--L-alanine ligase [Clostridiales Family XIII bacterium]|jgi:UDP-N-acetylmuramate--alanine ligase|nr:UDP-N-acetylmuramate--L-alanine ligase [Clostridiales Family XIII bacterium]
MIELSEVNHVHCIGIGGIGLSAVAEILLNEGYRVSGSDMNESDTTDRLIERGATVYLGHRARNVGDANLVVYSSAIPMTNPEIVIAREKGIPVVTRAQMLGHLMSGKPSSVAVAGAHGKTTTTAMISLVLRKMGKDPTILVGGNLPEIAGNVAVGSGEYFVTEACEYMDSFLSLSPKYAIILNIDSDHLDYFKDIDHIVRSFAQFANQVRDDGAIIAFDANPFVSSILDNTDRRVVTFGYNKRCDYSAGDIRFGEDGMPEFSVRRCGEQVCRIRLSIPGEHNISNALASFACCSEMGIEPEDIARTLEQFTGTQRRFDMRGETFGGVMVIDDYAHHPAEITATIRAARNIPHKSLWVLFQPHTYTRTLALHDDFAEALCLADKVVIAEIYAAREKNVHQITSKSIVLKMKEDDPGRDAWFFNSFEEIASFVLNNAEEGDLIITMGAGDIFKVGDLILETDRDAHLK